MGRLAVGTSRFAAMGAARRLAVAVGLTVVLTGCGGEPGSDGAPSGDAPSIEDLLARSADAIAEPDVLRVSFRTDVTVRVKLLADADPDAQKLLAEPLGLRATGALDGESLSASGTVSVAGSTYDGELRATPKGTFLRVQGQWFGTSDTPIGDATTQASRTTLADDVHRLQPQLRAALDVDTSGAPGNTWQAQGTCVPDGLLELADAAKAKVPGDDPQASARAVCDHAESLLGVDGDTWRPSRLDIDADLTESDLAALGGGSSGGVESMTIRSRTDLFGWGSSISVETPADVQPIEELFGDEG